jgi:hypothetical protein
MHAFPRVSSHRVSRALHHVIPNVADRQRFIRRLVFHVIFSTHCAREGPGSNAALKYCVSRVTLPSTNSMMLTT